LAAFSCLVLTDGSCLRLRPAFKGHVWSYDFIVARTRDRRAFRLLVIIDEYTRECLAIYVARRITSDDVLGVLAQLFVGKGVPCYLRSDNGTEFTAKVVREWLGLRPCTSSLAAPGRTATSSRSMASSGMSF
jgi:putative transposase